VNPTVCSFARLQKLYFCKRAFYFHYQANEEEFPPPLFSEIDTINQQTGFHLAKFQLLRGLLRELFYRRNLGHHQIKRELAQKGLLNKLDEFTIEQTIRNGLTFKESSFYQKTNPDFIKQFETNDISSFTIEEIKMLGNIDFSWYDRSGLNLVCLASKQNSHAKINFMLCYALRGMGAEIDKINIGLIHYTNDNWICKWQPVNWHDYQDYIDKILNFSPPQSLSSSEATNSLHKCNLCEYQQVCEDFKDSLDK